MTELSKTRIESVDLLKGLVMVIMALDHVRDYFHAGAFMYDPTDPTQTSLAVFFTRWITHFCAPAFCFLAGLSAFFVGRRKSKNELSLFLLKRGLWLVFLELTVVNFGWFFDIHFKTPGLLVIWSLGISMIFLAVMVQLPKTFVLFLSCLLIFGHNLLDNVHFEGSYLWAMLHDARIFSLPDSIKLYIYYPVVPWITVMSLGYCFGPLYNSSFDSNKRKKTLTIIGLSSILAFIAIRYINIYGDPKPWTHYDTFTQTLMSFLNPTKYPPSLLYLLMTLGVSFVFLANTEKLKGPVVNFFSTFGRVPFFYYILHLYFIHLTALIMAWLSGYGWQKMILPDWITEIPYFKGYGYSLGVTYLVWAAIIAILYPLCRKFDMYKQAHKEKWWLSYL